jgi:NADH-quinone oxidoreductase subunit E
MSVRRLADQQPASFAFTPENLEWAKHEIAKYPAGRQASAVIALLWRAQEQNDFWLSKPAIETVASMLEMPFIRVQLCGTTPCQLRGADAIKEVCRSKIGEQRQLSADGKFSWLEVECLGACCNAPMVQINEDYYEDLTPENFAQLLADLTAGKPVKKGSQTGRKSSEPMPGQGPTLNEPSLYDGSVVGSWRQRFDESIAAAAAAAADAAQKK